MGALDRYSAGPATLSARLFLAVGVYGMIAPGSPARAVDASLVLGVVIFLLGRVLKYICVRPRGPVSPAK